MLKKASFYFRILLMSFAIIAVFILFFVKQTQAYEVPYNYVYLSDYGLNMKVGDERNLFAYAPYNATVRFSSSDSKIAKVDKNGHITAKAPGRVQIKAKYKSSYAICTVTVAKTEITLGHTALSLQCGDSCTLSVKSSTGHTPKFKSDSTKIATVDKSGRIVAKKSGTTIVRVTVDKITVRCVVCVEKPVVTLDKTSITLYKGQSVKLNGYTSSKNTPAFKSSKKTVATVDERGYVTALKHGTTEISFKSDGIVKKCRVTVKQPVITFSSDTLTYSKGISTKLAYASTSPNLPTFTSSNSNVCYVTAEGLLKTVNKGRAYITAKDDGAKARIKVIVN